MESEENKAVIENPNSIQPISPQVSAQEQSELRHPEHSEGYEQSKILSAMGLKITDPLPSPERLSPQLTKPAIENSPNFIKFIVFVILFAPASLIGCGSGFCQGPTILLSAFAPVLMLDFFINASFFNYGGRDYYLGAIQSIFWSYLLSVILFALFWKHVDKYVKKQDRWTLSEKKIIKFFAYVCYWLFITAVWLLIPDLHAIFGPDFRRNDFIQMFSLNGLL